MPTDMQSAGPAKSSSIRQTGARPLVFAAAALSFGIVVGDSTDIGMAWWLGLGLVSCCALVAQLGEYVTTITAGALIFASGAASMTLSHSLPGNDIARIASRLNRDDAVPATMSGQISSFVIEDSARIKFEFLMDSIHGHNLTIPVQGLVRATIAVDNAPSESTEDLSKEGCRGMLRGMRVELTGRIYRPGKNQNPADFNYRQFLMRRGIGTLVFVKKLTNCRRVDDKSDRVADIRRWFKSAIAATVPGSATALSTALITGDRSGLETSTRQYFAESGLMHLLAISGLHVLFVGLTAYGLIKSTLVRFKLEWRTVETISTAFTLGLLSMYALITGATPSVVRASIMAGVFLSGRPLYRTSNSLNSLGTAAVVVLLIDPDSLFTSGFQLSFLAVFGLITAGATVTKAVNRRFTHRAPRWCFGLLGASAVATVSTAPVMMYQFGYIPLAGLLLNLIAIPLASGLLVASICAALISAWWISIAVSIGYAADLLSTLLALLAQFGGESASWSILRIPHHPAYLAIPAAITFSLYPGSSRRTRMNWVIAALSLPAVDLVYHASTGDYRPSVDVIFFDIGHGDAALIRLPSGATMLIDAGDRNRSWDYGKRVIIPHLNRENHSKLDAVVVSHPHGDHFGGLPAILRQIPIGCVYDNGKEVGTKLYKEYRSLVAANVRCHESLETGSVILLDSLVRFEVLAPTSGYEVEGENNESVVLKLIFGTTTFLFLGDVEQDGEQILVDQHCGSLKSDVVKVPHHGSKTSSTQGLIDCVSPTWAIISVGSQRKYGLPDNEILQRWQQTGTDVLVTRQEGAVRMKSDGSTIKVIH